MGTKKISQLEDIADAALSGEAILPVVVSDPLIPNRKARINQLFKGVGAGSKAEPGIAFDLDRNSGVYQNAYDQLGLSWGPGGVYFTRLLNSDGSTSNYLTALDDLVDNSDLVLAPKGTGSVRVTGQFRIDDTAMILEDSQGQKARFEISGIGSGTAIRIFNLPPVTAGNGTVLVGDDSQQTLRNKTILVDEDNFVLVDGDEEAVFQIDWDETVAARRSYFLPDAGAITTTAEANANHSTLLDTKTEQISLNKTFVSVKFQQTFDSEFSANINTSELTANRIITVPDLSLTLLGRDTTQIVTNKVYSNAIFASGTTISKKINFDLDNLLENTNETYQFPSNGILNNAGGNNILVTERAAQDLRNKTLLSPVVRPAFGGAGAVIFNLDNLQATRTISFPDADATLLSTDNVTLDDVTFGAGIGAATLTGRTRQQQFFYAGF
ncbi:hypothetical protein Sn110110_026 [Cyanophage S-RIM14]|uniref:YadA domain-containing structural protein n=1 Tax=Cyanophage S-RIM14 TaxID=1278423 RepID=A0A1D7SKR3_9CAUD|nr:hypothetical protein Sn110110_026 [Cyanophage S-RIM14]